MQNRFDTLWKALTRKKPLITSDIEKSKLPRVLGLIDLTALGVGTTLGMGVYVMAGSVSKISGPAVIFSFFIAGIAAALSGLCYGEFAARVPKAGSAYVYSYVAVGEFIAFVVGWSLTLENVIGTACVARALSGYLDNMIGNRISKYLSESLPMDYPFLSDYPDFFSFFIMLIFISILSVGVMLSSNFNKLFTSLNLTTILIVIAAGIYKADFQNWNIPAPPIPDKAIGNGGFLPFGYVSIFTGAARCFYAYTGFDTVATTGEEAKNPQRNVPLALILTLIIAFFAYLAISASLTLMVPYYEQDPTAPFPSAFDKVHLSGVKWVVTTGALCAMCASMVGSVYGTSRVVYSMACDGLLFKSLAKVNKRFETPLSSIVMVGLLTGFLSIIFDMEMLVDMSSIGTLSAYTLVSICVLLLRYESECGARHGSLSRLQQKNPKGSYNGDISYGPKATLIKKLFNLSYLSDSCRKNQVPTCTTSLVVKWMTIVVLLTLIVLTGCVTRGMEYIISFNPIVLLIFLVSALVLVMGVVSIARQPQTTEELSFKVRFVPLVPITSCLMNVSLMMMLNLQTWVRFVVWMFVGFIIYFGYGIQHSKESPENKAKKLTKHQKNEIPSF